MTTPEKLSWWDRFFNRYRRVIVEEGQETWSSESVLYGMRMNDAREFQRKFVKYKIIDRLTGSEKIEIDYLT